MKPLLRASITELRGVMLRISCPCCGSRDEEEFTFGGPWPHPRPNAPETLTDAEWADYLFTRENTRGRSTERWRHTYGCRQWLVCARDSVSHQIFSVRLINDGACPDPTYSQHTA